METLVPLAVVGIWKYLAAAWIRRDIERQFQYFGTVSCINLYPVKGCHATRVKSARCGARGLEVNGVKDRYDVITSKKACKERIKVCSIQCAMTFEMSCVFLCLIHYIMKTYHFKIVAI